MTASALGRGLTCSLQTRPKWLSNLTLNNSVGSMEIKLQIFQLKDNTFKDVWIIYSFNLPSNATINLHY